VILMHAGLMVFGWAGVWIFFVVSGFAVTLSLLRAEPGPRLRRIRHFYMRRILRIMPLYGVFLALNVLFLLASGRTAPLSNLPFLLSFTYDFRYGLIDFGDSPTSWSPFGTMWSLSVEEQFYLLFPWLFLFLSRRTLVGVLVGLVGACLVVRWGLVADLVTAGWQGPHINAVVYSFAPGHFDAFAAGALIALFRDDIAQRPALARNCMIAALSLAGLYMGIFVTLQAMRSTFFHAFHNVVAGVLVGDFKEVFVYPVMWGLAAALLMLILSGERWVLMLCRAPWVQTIGRMSFGLYIVHIPVFMLVRVLVTHTSLDALPHPVDRVLILVIVLPISCGLAAASWHFLEQPVLRIRSRFG